MDFYKDQYDKVAEITFIAEIISETSMTPVITKLGKQESTMALYCSNDPDCYFIEWDIPNLETVELINIWCEKGTKCIVDYDGVFALPSQAIELLQNNDFDTSLVE